MPSRMRHYIVCVQLNQFDYAHLGNQTPYYMLNDDEYNCLCTLFE